MLKDKNLLIFSHLSIQLYIIERIDIVIVQYKRRDYMKKLGENLYSQTVVFDLVRFDNRKELVKKSIEKDECIKELLKTNMLFGESWFTKKYQSEEFKSGGLSRINTVNLSNAAIKIESITYIENGYKFDFIRYNGTRKYRWLSGKLPAEDLQLKRITKPVCGIRRK